MNFALNFFVDKDTHPFDLREMRLLFAKIHSFYEKLQSRESPTWRVAREFVYDNGVTGVHFTLHYDKPAQTSLTTGKYTRSGLHLEMELPRASFFGYEAMRVVAVIMKDLDLLAACSSHVSGTPEPPKRLAYDELVALWMNANEQETTEARARRDDFYYAEGNKLLYWWRYTTEAAKLEASMEDSDIAVPQIMFYAKKGSDKVVTICEWPNFRRTILPIVDYVLLERLTARSPRSARRGATKVTRPRKKELGMVLFKDAARVVKEFSMRVEKPVPRLICSLDDAPPEVKEDLLDLAVKKARAFKRLTPNDLIDKPTAPESSEAE